MGSPVHGKQASNFWRFPAPELILFLTLVISFFLPLQLSKGWIFLSAGAVAIAFLCSIGLGMTRSTCWFPSVIVLILGLMLLYGMRSSPSGDPDFGKGWLYVVGGGFTFSGSSDLIRRRLAINKKVAT